jgi:general secretion pathway protein G
MKKWAFWGRSAKQAGFSLLEIIIVIAIIGTLVGIIVNRISSGTDNAKLGVTATKAATLQSKLMEYQLKHDNKFPTTEQGLQVLLTGWGNPFDYKLSSKGPLIISMGKDGVPEGTTQICYIGGKEVDCAQAQSN